MIKHIPHSSTYIPEEYRNFIGEYVDLSDKNVLEIFGSGKCIIFPIDRTICDVERFINGESMEAVGMGICYTNNAHLKPFRIVTSELREEIINKYYIPHHNLLTKMVEQELNDYGNSLIIDCHTYRKEPWEYEDKNKYRPEICIGINKSTKRSDIVIDYLQKYFDIGVNSPFAGALVPIKYIDDKRVESIMFEVRQDVDIEKARFYINEVLTKINNEKN